MRPEDTRIYRLSLDLVRHVQSLAADQGAGFTPHKLQLVQQSAAVTRHFTAGLLRDQERARKRHLGAAAGAALRVAAALERAHRDGFIAARERDVGMELGERLHAMIAQFH